ncbi:hypothetical protein RN001_006836 [Aquatica leii]|uniref:Aldehyde dehydrogenase domain-containing protein n=1 Tax=Aquatica leii TaxID=1421715 RepID=A0AAN7SIT5_9COLE|nr:hypothetical protein RN001_006836 [Aquatica leii]
MATGSQKIQVKNSNIKNIFETMEYGEITENIDLAKEWCKKAPRIHVEAIGTALGSFLLSTRASTEWLNKPALEKCVILERFAQEIEKNAALIYQLEVFFRGIPLKDTKTKALPLLIDFLQYYAHWPMRVLHNYAGVAFSSIDDCCFLGMVGSVLGPALAVGYNIIFHAERKSVAIIQLLIELGENAGIPKGTLFLVTGDIDFKAMFDNSGVISFPGNLHSLKFKDIEIKHNTKIVGVAKGKTPMIVFNNADLDSASDSVIDAAWGYASILPWNLDTILVQEDVFEKFVNKLKDRLSKVKMGTAFNKLADLAYPAAGNAFEILQKTLLTAKSYGIEVFQTYSSSEQFQPTILIGGKVSVNNVILGDDDSMVVSVLPFRTANEAVNLANNRTSGIGASVWSENIALTNEVAKKLNFSNIWINSFGNFSPSTSFSPYKDSGIGFIGGEEGFYEYFIGLPKMTIEKKFENSNKQGPLLQSFYDGAFKKSESGIQDGSFEVPVAKDLLNAVEAALKGFDTWKKLTLFNRSQILRRLALEMNLKKQIISVNTGISETKINKWIELTYAAFSYLCNTGNVTQNKSMSIQTIKEPLGVVAIEETYELEDSFLRIIASLMLGNCVIVFNVDRLFSKFYVEICKILISLKFPAGVFNVILNINSEVVQGVLLHKELVAYFPLDDYAGYGPSCKSILRNFKKVNFPIDNWSQTLHLTKIKNIWCDVGDSVV